MTGFQGGSPNPPALSIINEVFLLGATDPGTVACLCALRALL
jgi:hypothetical protein